MDGKQYYKMNETKSNLLYICDLANNHFGDVKHAKRIIDDISEVARRTEQKIAVKFQFRDLDTYIHRDYVKRKDLKYIDRFLSTRLNKSDFEVLTHYIKSKKLVTMATPFDEVGLAWCIDLNIEIIKIASASSNDYPLIDAIASTSKPVVASTAGLRIEEIDNLVSRLYGKVPDLVLMHCVAIYPSIDEELNLSQIRSLQVRYPKIGVGFSTHENPESMSPVLIATALGAVALERHVGIQSEKYSLNSYSSQPEQIQRWIETSLKARGIMGPKNRKPAPAKETTTLNELKRGIFASRKVVKGEKLTSLNCYFAFPLVSPESDYHAGYIDKNLIATQEILPHESICTSNSMIHSDDSQEIISSIVLQVRGMLAEARIELNDDASVEISHHYGISRFREFGAILITCYNNEYAKKIVIQLPRQKHPYHFHKKKKETFQLLWGDMELVVDGINHQLSPGELFTVERGEWHKFHTLHGAVVEEISTQAESGDSFYEDIGIQRLPIQDRKTIVDIDLFR
jgi:N-acetylneuraminate synthase